MIVTLAAAHAYCARIDPAASLPEACAAIRSSITSSRTAEAASRQPWCVVPTRRAKLIVERGFVTNVWPRGYIVSRGMIGGVV